VGFPVALRFFLAHYDAEARLVGVIFILFGALDRRYGRQRNAADGAKRRLELESKERSSADGPRA
jgi:hypothetical protein